MYLGLDLSTQSVTAVVLDGSAQTVVHRVCISYERDLADDPLVPPTLVTNFRYGETVDPRMWAGGLRAVLRRLAASGITSQISGIAVAAQQRGTVYLNDTRCWDLLDGAEGMAVGLSRAEAPTWLNDTAHRECEEIEEAVGGSAPALAITGSRMMPRSSGAQIRKFFKESPEAYAETDHITLPSGFATSFLVGHDVPIELGDACASGLLDIAASAWSDELLCATAPGLRLKLPGLGRLGDHAGVLASPLAREYGFGANTTVMVGTGDNIASALALGSMAPGVLAVSLGSSHTVFGEIALDRRDPEGYGSILALSSDAALGISVLRNGALTLGHVLDYVGEDLDSLELLFAEPEPTTGTPLVLPFLGPEITPRLGALGVCAVQDAPALISTSGWVRGLVESQVIRLAVHSAWLGHADTIRLTGGASRSPGYAQTVSDFFGRDVMTLQVSDGTALGAALLAAAGVTRASTSEVSTAFLRAQPRVYYSPRPTKSSRCQELTERYRHVLPLVMANAQGGPRALDTALGEAGWRVSRLLSRGVDPARGVLPTRKSCRARAN